MVRQGNNSFCDDCREYNELQKEKWEVEKMEQTNQISEQEDKAELEESRLPKEPVTDPFGELGFEDADDGIEEEPKVDRPKDAMDVFF